MVIQKEIVDIVSLSVLTIGELLHRVGQFNLRKDKIRQINCNVAFSEGKSGFQITNRNVLQRFA